MVAAMHCPGKLTNAGDSALFACPIFSFAGMCGRLAPWGRCFGLVWRLKWFLLCCGLSSQVRPHFTRQPPGAEQATSLEFAADTLQRACECLEQELVRCMPLCSLYTHCVAKLLYSAAMLRPQDAECPQRSILI